MPNQYFVRIILLYCVLYRMEHWMKRGNKNGNKNKEIVKYWDKELYGTPLSKIVIVEKWKRIILDLYSIIGRWIARLKILQEKCTKRSQCCPTTIKDSQLITNFQCRSTQDQSETIAIKKSIVRSNQRYATIIEVIGAARRWLASTGVRASGFYFFRI